MEPSLNNPSHQPSARHTEAGDRFNRTLFAALEALEKYEVHHALIGGVAASGLGRPRSTHDIDIFVRPEDAEAAVEALARADFKTEKTDFNWLFKGWKEDILVDIIFKSSGDFYFDEEMQARTQLVNYHGRMVRAVSPEDLCLIKCAVHSETGPHHWHDALALLSFSTLDWDYLVRRGRRAPRRLLALLIYAQSNDILVPNSTVLELFETVFGVVKKIAPRPHPAPAPTPSLAAHPPMHHETHPAYTEGKIKDALARDERTGEQNVKILVQENRVLVRGESHSENQKHAISEVIQLVVPGMLIENQVTIPYLPGPEGAEVIV